jgi:hypothetical protein
MKNIVKALHAHASKLEHELSGVRAAIVSLSGERKTTKRKTYKLSVATRRRMSVAMKARWKAKRKTA